MANFTNAPEIMGTGGGLGTGLGGGGLPPEMHEYIEMEIMQIMQENDEIIQKENAENMELVKLFK